MLNRRARGLVIASPLISTAIVMKRWLWDTPARLLIGVTISLILGWLSVRGMEWGLVVDQFRDFPAGWAIASLAIIVLASFVRAYRWQLLFLRQRVSLMRLFAVQNAGIGLNNLVPVRVVSEGVLFALLTLRYGVKGGVALGAIAAEKILDMVVTAALLMAGLTLLSNKGDFLPYVVGAFVVAMASVLAVPFLIWLGKKPSLKRIPFLVSTVDFLSDLVRAKGTLTYAFLLTLGYWLLVGICAWVLAFGMGLGITAFAATLAILGTLYFTTALPSLPAAAGTFEFATVYVLKFFGVSQALAFSYAVVIHAVLFLPPVLVAIVVFSSIGLRPAKQLGAAAPMEKVEAVSMNHREGQPR